MKPSKLQEQLRALHPASPEKIACSRMKQLMSQILLNFSYEYDMCIRTVSKMNSFFCDQLKRTTEAMDVFFNKNEFLILTLYRGILWSLFVLLVPQLCWEKIWFHFSGQKVNPNVVSSHCILHQHALALKHFLVVLNQF